MKRRLKTTLLAKLASQYCTVLLCLVSLSFSANATKVDDCIPRDSFVYLQLQDLDEVYAEIQMSENWAKVMSLLTNTSPEVEELSQGLTMALGMLGTDLSGLIETIGYQTGFAMWQDGAGEIGIGIVVHSGGNLGELQRFTKIVEGLLGMSDTNTLHLDAGVYQRVRYNALEMNGGLVKYGFVDEFLVVGGGEGSFEKLMDTYRKDAPSIRQNPEFARALKKMGSGEVIVFADVGHALSLNRAGLSAWEWVQLPIFQFMFGRLNLLETGSFLQVAVQFNPNLPENAVGLFLKEGAELRTLKGLSGKEDLFIAVAPPILEGVWQLVRTKLDTERTDSIDLFFSKVEGAMNLTFEGDMIPALTGELALSVSDLAQFDPVALNSLEINFDGTFEIDAAGVETHGGLIFNSNNPLKWNQLGNSTFNLQNASVSHTDYKGTVVSTFASNIHYGTANGLFLLSFSEEQMHTLIDGINQKKKPSYLKQWPQTPIAVVQLNVARALAIETGAPPADILLATSKEISPLRAWVSVKENEAVLEATLSEKEVPLEVLAKLAPFIVWRMNNQ